MPAFAARRQKWEELLHNWLPSTSEGCQYVLELFKLRLVSNDFIGGCLRPVRPIPLSKNTDEVRLGANNLVVNVSSGADHGSAAGHSRFHDIQTEYLTLIIVKRLCLELVLSIPISSTGSIFGTYQGLIHKSWTWISYM